MLASEKAWTRPLFDCALSAVDAAVSSSSHHFGSALEAIDFIVSAPNKGELHAETMGGVFPSCLDAVTLALKAGVSFNSAIEALDFARLKCVFLSGFFK